MDDLTRHKLQMLIPRLASNHSGEVVATVAAIVRTLKGASLDLHDLAKSVGGGTVERVVYRERERPVSEFAEKAAFCADHMDHLRSKEMEFIRDMNAKLQWMDDLSPRQAAWLETIYQRIKRETENAA